MVGVAGLAPTGTVLVFRAGTAPALFLPSQRRLGELLAAMKEEIE